LQAVVQAVSSTRRRGGAALGRRRSAPEDEPSKPGHLLVSREQFAAELDARIQQGQELQLREIRTPNELEAARSDLYTWDDYNAELLRRRFTTNELAEEYSFFGVAFVGGRPSFQEGVSELRSDIANKLRRLESVRERLPLFEEAATVRPPGVVKQGAPDPEVPGTIFVVHGQDHAAKLAVQGFIRQVTDLDPVVLHDQPNMGRTLIEKFEGEGARAAFAVVVLTADDEGRAVRTESDGLSKRGRQNVVFEFGYFVGALGRSQTAVLYEPGVELPSDLQGLVYIPLDAAGGWKLLLARELKAAGIDVDANALV
jgi:predicted nucleotide-binding protein